MKVVWLAEANEDRVAIYDYIEQTSPQNAVSVDEEFLHAAEVLAGFPEIGRQGRVKGQREWVLTRIGYILIYRINDSVLEITAVLRSTRNRSFRKPKL